MHRKLWIEAAETGDEVIFPCANGTFSKVATMNVWWY